MKAVIYSRYGAPDVLRIAEIAKPVPAGNEVLIKIHATTVTIGDTRMRSFTVPAAQWLFARLYLGVLKPKRAIPGMELAGVIKATGEHVTRFQPGDPVFASTFEVGFGGYAEYFRVHHNLTNETDPTQLPAAVVVALYWQRWRIEEALNVVKRLLGLAYFWDGSINAIQTQLWATWMVYAVLIDLTDAVAEELRQPFRALSVEMIYRGLYHFTQARQRGKTDDVVAYLAAEAKGLGILKRKRHSPKDAFLAVLTNHGIP